MAVCGNGVGNASTLDPSTKAIVAAQLRTAGQRAAHTGQAATLKLLLQRGCDLGLGFGNGRCVHVEVAARGHVEVLEVLLVEARASLETQNGYGRTCPSNFGNGNYYHVFGKECVYF